MLTSFYTYSTDELTLIPHWVAGCSLWVLLTLPFMRAAGPAQRLVAWFSAALLLVALGCVLLPHRAYLHYIQLMVMPGTLALAAGIGLVINFPGKQPARWQCALLCGALIFSAGFVLWGRARGPIAYVGQLELYQTRRLGVVSRELVKYSRPGEAVGVWGWMYSCYAEPGLRRATRSGDSTSEIVAGPYQDYFLRRYLSDLRAETPPVFVDAVGPANFVYKSTALRHEQQFPALADYIRAHYTLVADLRGTRVYARNDRLLPPAH